MTVPAIEPYISQQSILCRRIEEMRQGEPIFRRFPAQLQRMPETSSLARGSSQCEGSLEGCTSLIHSFPRSAGGVLCFPSSRSVSKIAKIECNLGVREYLDYSLNHPLSLHTERHLSRGVEQLQPGLPNWLPMVSLELIWFGFQAL